MLLSIVLAAASLGFSFGILAIRYQALPAELVSWGQSRIANAPQPNEMEDVGLKAGSVDVLALASLGYVEATHDAESQERGVMVSDETRAAKGLNFYNSKRERSAKLVDLHGEVVHEWSYETRFPWNSSELLEDGDVLVIQKDHELVRLDRDSNLEWSYQARVHHDLDVFEDRIYTLTRKTEARPEFHTDREIIVDCITVLSPEGRELESISILDTLQRSPYAYLLPSLSEEVRASEGPALDILHANHVELLRKGFEDRSPAFAAGNILVSLRNLNSIAVLDGTTREVLWLWGPGNLTRQHHPRLLDNGHILLFDNGTEQTGSRVVELDPVSARVVWSYAADGFFSPTRGSVQRLPNGNTLITESDPGYVFEVDPDGDIVWKFGNPDLDDEGRRGAIWRMTRFARENLSFLTSVQLAQFAP
jgi:hypothetical protein